MIMLSAAANWTHLQWSTVKSLCTRTFHTKRPSHVLWKSKLGGMMIDPGAYIYYVFRMDIYIGSENVRGANEYYINIAVDSS